MTAKSVKIVITWMETKSKRLPQTLSYSTVAKFGEDLDSWQEDAWSIVLDFEESPETQGNPSVGTARFLVPSAPHERLVSARIFELFEGAEKVADVRVL